MHKNRFSNFKLQIALLCCVVILLSGCALTIGLSAVLGKKVKPKYYTYEDKSIIFTSLVHFGQKEFYDNLRDSIIDWKKDGYTIFYEQVGSGQAYLGLDSISYDRLRRRFRQIDGGNAGTAEDYAKEVQQVFKNGIAQPNYKALGIDSSDINADISLLDLVNKLEEYYGEIKLDSCDYATHLDSTYTCSKGIKMKKLDPIYVDYRNSVVVEKVIASNSDKIVILFGTAHRKGMKRLLDEKLIGSTK